jgi:hypothetical protein
MSLLYEGIDGLACSPPLSPFSATRPVVQDRRSWKRNSGSKFCCGVDGDYFAAQFLGSNVVYTTRPDLFSLSLTQLLNLQWRLDM